MVVNKLYCYDDALINYNLRFETDEDRIRRRVFDYIYTRTGLASMVDKTYNYKRIGKETDCFYEEILYLTALGDLFVSIKMLTECSNKETFDEILEEYKLDCIECVLRCRYQKGYLVNELIELLALRVPLIGISYMTIQGPNDEPDCVPFEPVAP